MNLFLLLTEPPSKKFNSIEFNSLQNHKGLRFYISNTPTFCLCHRDFVAVSVEGACSMSSFLVTLWKCRPVMQAQYFVSSDQ